MIRATFAGMIPARLIAACLCLPAAPAAAEFAVCNQSFDVVNVAVGQFQGAEMVTEGWWTIGPNQCANVIRDELTARFIYVFAQDVFGKDILAGTTPLCIDAAKFRIRGEADCAQRGYLAVPFVEVDTLRSERWTLFLSAQG